MTSKAVLTGVFTLFVMNTRTLEKCFGILALLGLLAACGGNGSGSGTGPDAATAVIGPAGGTLTGPDGVQVVIPDGALDQPTEISIARRSAGAPAVLDAYPAAGSIYEFTPHDLFFNRPITIRAPVLSGASDTSVFMASPGKDWELENVTVIGGVAEWARNSFSWMYPPIHGCAVPPSMENNPYWCLQPKASGHPTLSATPTGALSLISAESRYNIYSFSVDQAAMVQIGSVFRVAGNCSNVTVELQRRRFNPTTMLWEPPLTQSGQRLLSLSPGLTVGADNRYLIGSVNFSLPFTYLDQGKNHFAWWLSYSCPTPLKEGGYGSNRNHDIKIGDLILLGNIPAPSVFYSVGGTVSGLTGSGLVLQNNGGDNLPITATGAFTFASPVGEGLPYRVTVLTQPAGQTCSVTNGSGTITANVTVAVNCAARTVRTIRITPPNPTPAGCAPLPRAGHTVTFTATGGTAPYSWISSEVGPTNLTVISTTQAQWYDSRDRFCGVNGNVTITATDSTGSSGSVTFPVLGIY